MNAFAEFARQFVTIRHILHHDAPKQRYLGMMEEYQIDATAPLTGGAIVVLGHRYGN